MKYPKISIVTANYNGEKFLEETILSVLNQNYPNLEYIVIDGGSTDSSLDIIKKYENQLHFWCSEPDKGHADALNKGFKKCTGDIMAWINSDDMYFPWTFKAVAEIFCTYDDVYWIKGLHSHFSELGVLLKSNTVYKNIFDYLIKDYKWIQQESVFWRRELWEKSGGFINEDYRFMVDGELWSRFFLYEDIWHVNIPLGGLRHHKSRRAPNNMSTVLLEMDKCIDAMRPNITNDILEVLSDFKTYSEISITHKNALNSFANSKSHALLPNKIYQYFLAWKSQKMRKTLHLKKEKLNEHPRFKYKKILFSNLGIGREIANVI